MKPSQIFIALVQVLILGMFSITVAQEPVDEAANTFFRAEGLEHSQVMEIASWLTDVYGPRLTGSPNLDQASEWAMQQLELWGLENVYLDEWGPFGRGWTFERFSMHVTAPSPFPVLAYPKAWSSGTEGTVQGEVVYLDVESEADFEKYRGQLEGKIVLLDSIRDVGPWFEPTAERRDAEDLLELANAVPTNGQGFRGRGGGGAQLSQQRIAFLYEEKPLAILDRGSKGDHGAVFVGSASVPALADASYANRPRPWDVDVEYVVPQVVVAAEHYNRIMRTLEKGIPVFIEMNLAATFHEDNLMDYNVLGEIPGTDPDIGDEVVMLGAHFDSWHTGTGATDNASGSAVMMEALRILKKYFDQTGIQPRRTIRIALWTGEEQGLNGSRAYVAEHFAEGGRGGQPVQDIKPAHDNVSGYYNFDNGTGKIRGVYLQGNEEAGSIFRSWFQPFTDLGAGTVSISNTSGTDHLSFDAVGIPGFQFIQDPVAYSTRTHHSNLDTFDHLVEDDLKQAATIIASFVYHTAQRDEKIPRKLLSNGRAAGTN